MDKGMNICNEVENIGNICIEIIGLSPVVDFWHPKEKKSHENVEEVKDSEEDHQVVKRLLGALPREDEDAQQVAQQTHRPDGDHEDPFDEELEHVEVALHLLHLLILARHLALLALLSARPTLISLAWVCNEGVHSEKACRSL